MLRIRTYIGNFSCYWSQFQGELSYIIKIKTHLTCLRKLDVFSVLKKENQNRIIIMVIIKKNNIILISIVFILVALMVIFTYKNHMEKTIQTSSSPSKYEILVDVEESKLYLLEDGKLNKTYKCSGRKVVYSFTNRNMDYNFKRYMGRRLWR